MSHWNSETPPSKVLGFFRGLGELAEFAKESGLAVLELAFGRWPQPFGERTKIRDDEAIVAPARPSLPPQDDDGPVWPTTSHPAAGEVRPTAEPELLFTRRWGSDDRP